MQNFAQIFPSRQRHGCSHVAVGNKVQPSLPTRARQLCRLVRRVALPIRPLLGRGSAGYLDVGGLKYGSTETAESRPGPSAQVAADLLRHRSKSSPNSEKRRVPRRASTTTTAAAVCGVRFSDQWIFQAAGVFRRILPFHRQPETKKRFNRNGTVLAAERFRDKLLISDRRRREIATIYSRTFC